MQRIKSRARLTATDAVVALPRNIRLGLRSPGRGLVQHPAAARDRVLVAGGCGGSRRVCRATSGSGPVATLKTGPDRGEGMTTDAALEAGSLRGGEPRREWMCAPDGSPGVWPAAEFDFRATMPYGACHRALDPVVKRAGGSWGSLQQRKAPAG